MAVSIILKNSTKIHGLTKATQNLSRIAYFHSAKSGNPLVNGSSSNLLTKYSQKVNISNLLWGKRLMSSHGDHGKLWTVEKIISLALLGVVPAMFITPNPILDNIFAVAVVTHMHWGLEACVIDYVRPIIVGPALAKIALVLLYVVSATTLGGLLYYNYNCIGIGQTFRKLWEIKN